MVQTGIEEGKVALTDGEKSLGKFVELPSMEKKNFFKNHLGTKVDEIFLEEEEGDKEMAGN